MRWKGKSCKDLYDLPLNVMQTVKRIAWWPMKCIDCRSENHTDRCWVWLEAIYEVQALRLVAHRRRWIRIRRESRGL